MSIRPGGDGCPLPNAEPCWLLFCSAWRASRGLLRLSYGVGGPGAPSQTAVIAWACVFCCRLVVPPWLFLGSASFLHRYQVQLQPNLVYVRYLLAGRVKFAAGVKGPAPRQVKTETRRGLAADFTFHRLRHPVSRTQSTNQPTTTKKTQQHHTVVEAQRPTTPFWD